ncbi:pectinesterase inhibitor 9-like [Carex rostrata]
MASIPFSFSLLLVSCSMVTASTNQNSSSFIRTSCSLTLYPDLCYSSLSPYKSQVGNNPVMLARFAMNVTIGSLKPLSMYIDSVLQRTAADPSSGALKDCKELIGDAIDLVRKSEKEITGLEVMVGSQVNWRIGNAQTWLSAAMTNEGTCVNGFEEVGSGGSGEDVEMEVRQKITRAKQHTSNALAIVNSLRNSY